MYNLLSIIKAAIIAPKNIDRCFKIPYNYWAYITSTIDPPFFFNLNLDY